MSKRFRAATADDDDGEYNEQTAEPAHKIAKRSAVNPARDGGGARRDFATAFSDELSLHVFEKFSAADLSTCSRVCRQWYRLANDRQLWKRLFLSKFRPPSRPNLSSRLETIQTSQGARRAILDRRLGVGSLGDADREDWKNIYRVSHNWQTGNCRVIDFRPYVGRTDSDNEGDVGDGDGDSHRTTTRLNERNLSRVGDFHQWLALKCNPLVQFTKHVILTASYSSRVAVPEVQLWRTDDRMSLIGTLASDSLVSARNSVFITCLELDNDEHEEEATGMQRVVAGYSNGGFSIWTVDTVNRHDGPWNHHELCTVIPASNTPLIACTLRFPILVTCTSRFVLSIYHLSSPQDNVDSRLECRMLHQLISFVCKPPIEVTVEESEDSVWRAIVAYSSPVYYGGGWTVGVQEIKFSMTTIVSTRHCTPCPPSAPPFVSISAPLPDPAVSFSPMTTIIYKAGYLVTAHTNNTLLVFRVDCTDEALECRHVQTLYGHTGSVMTVAIDEHGKLITGAMDKSIKIWDLKPGMRAARSSQDGHFGQVGAPDRVGSLCGSVLDAILTDFEQESRAECVVTLIDVRVDRGGIKWVGFDEGRIVSVIGGGHGEGWDTLQAVDMNASPPPGWTPSSDQRAVNNGAVDEIGVVKVWSFCDE